MTDGGVARKLAATLALYATKWLDGETCGHPLSMRHNSHYCHTIAVKTIRAADFSALALLYNTSNINTLHTDICREHIKNKLFNKYGIHLSSFYIIL